MAYWTNIDTLSCELSLLRKAWSPPEIVVASGYFNPLGSHHLYYLEEAKRYCRNAILVVIVNNDGQVDLKSSCPFMEERQRLEIISSLRCVDYAILSIDKDLTVRKTLAALKPDVFANGGDCQQGSSLEREACKELKIREIYGVGGGKIGSSSSLIKNAIIWHNSRFSVDN